MLINEGEDQRLLSKKTVIMHGLYADLQDNKQTISNGEPKSKWK